MAFPALVLLLAATIVVGCNGEVGPADATAFAMAADVTGRGEIVATVSGRPITVEDVIAHARQHGLDAQAALDDLIAFEVLALEAETRGLSTGTEVAAVRKTAMVRRFLETFAAEHGIESIPEGSLRNLYEMNRHWMVHARLVWVSHILAEAEAGAPELEVAAGRELIEWLRGRAVALPRYCFTPCTEDARCADDQTCVDAICTANGNAETWCALHEDCESAAMSNPGLAGSKCEAGTCVPPCTDAAACGTGAVCRPMTSAFLSLATGEETKARVESLGPHPDDPKTPLVRVRPERLIRWWPADAPAAAVDQDWLAAAHALTEPGELSLPVRSAFGWHLILLEAVEGPTNISFDAARERIATGSVGGFQRTRLQELLTSLEQAHEIRMSSEAAVKAFSLLGKR